MSCLAGLAAELKPFPRLVEGRPMWVVDGCPIGCAKAIFARLGRPIDYYIRLDDYGVRKKTGLAHDADLEALVDQVVGRSSLQATRRALPTPSNSVIHANNKTALHNSGPGGL
jgi:uncharacterized metal-binding protein